MNTLESYSMLNPYNKMDECAKFVIDDLTELFNLSGVATIGVEYTLSFWAKSEAGGSISVCGEPVDAPLDWTYHSITFVAAATEVYFQFTTADTYYIYHPQLEIGNTYSDWRPSPDDVGQSIAEISARLEMLPGEITMEFSRTTNAIQDSMDDNFGKIYKHISFTENGIMLKTGDNILSLVLDTSGIVFAKNGVEFGLWDGTNFYTGNIVVRVEERAQFGNFAFVPRSDGSLSFLKVGE